jgi:hypothetical protein
MGALYREKRVNMHQGAALSCSDPVNLHWGTLFFGDRVNLDQESQSCESRVKLQRSPSYGDRVNCNNWL